MYYRMLACCCLLTAAIAPPTQAAVYQWTDEHGHVHFGDRPHEGATERVLPTSAPKASSSKGLAQNRRQRRQRMLDVYEQERADKREAVQKAKQAREARKKQCLNARARYDGYSNAGSIYNYLESGEREYLDKAQRQRFIVQLKAEVERYCD
jgi:hypothetical protein